MNKYLKDIQLKIKGSHEKLAKVEEIPMNMPDWNLNLKYIKIKDAKLRCK